MIPTATEPGATRRGETAAAAQSAIERSRAFLQQRLHPDLAAAEARLAVLNGDRAAYIDLARELRKRRDTAAGTDATTGLVSDGPRPKMTTTLLNAPLGFGIYAPVEVDVDAHIIVNLGLSQSSSTALGLAERRSSEGESASAEENARNIEAGVSQVEGQDGVRAQSDDAGLYAELTVMEALAYIQKKVPIIDRKISIAREKVASIQGHVELTTRSIEQLEALQGREGASFLDLVAAS